MIIRPALARLGVTIPFFVLASLVLGFFSRPVSRAVDAPAHASAFLIVTTESLRPPFQALESWNHERGCPTLLLTLGNPGSRGDLGSAVGYVSALCALRGTYGMLLGGDSRLLPLVLPVGGEQDPGPRASAGGPQVPRLVPVSPLVGLPAGLRVSRAPVRDLAEAWEFVNACRASGRTLDQLVGEGAPLTAVAATGGIRFPDGRPAAGYDAATP